MHQASETERVKWKAGTREVPQFVILVVKCPPTLKSCVTNTANSTCNSQILFKSGMFVQHGWLETLRGIHRTILWSTSHWRLAFGGALPRLNHQVAMSKLRWSFCMRSARLCLFLEGWPLTQVQLVSFHALSWQVSPRSRRCEVDRHKYTLLALWQREHESSIQDLLNWLV